MTPGYLYSVAEEVESDDVRPHPHPVNVDHWEWLTNREIRLELIEDTIVTEDERLTDEEIADLRRRAKERGGESFVERSSEGQ